MDPFGGAPYSFPRANGDPENRFYPRRGRRRQSRPPSWVRTPLTTLQHSTTSTSRRSIQYHSRGALQPIARFCCPQDPRTATEGHQPPSALMDYGSSRDILLFLQAATRNVREQVFWGICLQVFEFFKHQPLPLHSPWLKIFLSRQCPSPLREFVLHHLPSNKYQQEYEEEEELGHGGFGRVVKARRKLDGCYYAIKMITIEDLGEASVEGCLQEVRTLAKLDHPRVVRYYYNWIQEDVWSQHHTSATLTELYTSDSDDEYSEDSSSDNSVSAEPPPAGQGGAPPDNDSVIFQDTGTGREGEAQHPCLGTNNKQTPDPTPSMNRSRVNGSLLPYRPQVLARPRKVLYIQMKLYGKSLRKWLDERNASDVPVVVVKECLRIFHQVLEAMGYIHQQGYMHRDIKPENILFGVDGNNVHLGDFGLARLMTHPLHASCNTNPTSNTYTLNVGTPSYSAPEVKHGNYGEKSDMYSLGIILLELFKPFKTGMEKVNVLKNLKENTLLDPDLSPPPIADWIKKLVDKDPANRPSARELLESSLFIQPDPPPSTTTTAGDTVAGRFPGQTLVHTSQTVEEAAANTVHFTRSEITSVRSIKIKEINGAESVNNCTVHIEERLSKDEEIALLKQQNAALKQKVEELERNLKHCKIVNNTQLDQC